MKKISLIALLLTVSFIPNTNAQQVKADGEAYRTTWGVPADFKRCGGLGKDAGFTDTDVGTNAKWRRYLKDSFTESGTGYWGYGAWYWVAHEMTDHGYKFCKTAVGADRSGQSNHPYTIYGKVTDAEEDNGGNCFWLCEKGYYGDGCNSVTLESPETPKEKDFNIITNRAKIATGGAHSLSSDTVGTLKSNIEANIPMFYNGVYETCSGGLQINLLKMTKKQEHDVVLAIKKIETSGSKVTYTLQPMVVRAASAPGYGDTGWPMISWTGNENNTYCPAGMFLHSDDGGCIGYDKDVADAQDLSDTEKTQYEAAMEKAAMIEKSGLDLLCSGWPREKYDNTVHVLNSEAFMYQNWRKLGDTSNNYLTKEEYIKSKCPGMDSTCVSNVGNSYDSLQNDVNATCTVFVCKGEGMGYKSDPMGAGAGDFTCVSCMQNDDATIHPSRLGVGSDGICKVCAVGEVYSSTTKTCETAKSIHKYYMGGLLKKNETGGATPLDLKYQCWTKPTPDEYKACINATGYADGLLPTQNSGGGGE